MIRVLVCGARDWAAKNIIVERIRQVHKQHGISCIIEGECKGADLIARQIGEKMGITVEPYPADWARYGPAAGPLRNGQMIKQGKPDLVLAFHNDLSQSKGTQNMIRQARQVGIRVRLFSTEGEYK